jgi:hypothetical protein
VGNHFLILRKEGWNGERRRGKKAGREGRKGKKRRFNIGLCSFGHMTHILVPLHHHHHHQRI